MPATVVTVVVWELFLQHSLPSSLLFGEVAIHDVLLRLYPALVSSLVALWTAFS